MVSMKMFGGFSVVVLVVLGLSSSAFAQGGVTGITPEADKILTCDDVKGCLTASEAQARAAAQRAAAEKAARDEIIRIGGQGSNQPFVCEGGEVKGPRVCECPDGVKRVEGKFGVLTKIVCLPVPETSETAVGEPSNLQTAEDVQRMVDEAVGKLPKSSSPPPVFQPGGAIFLVPLERLVVDGTVFAGFIARPNVNFGFTAQVDFELWYRLTPTGSTFFGGTAGPGFQAAQPKMGPTWSLETELGFLVELNARRNQLLRLVVFGEQEMSTHPAGSDGMPSQFRSGHVGPMIGLKSRWTEHFHTDFKCGVGIGPANWVNEGEAHLYNRIKPAFICLAGLGFNSKTGGD